VASAQAILVLSTVLCGQTTPEILYGRGGIAGITATVLSGQDGVF